jgi:cytochrome c oxidase cbb3-type subunit III
VITSRTNTSRHLAWLACFAVSVASAQTPSAPDAATSATLYRTHCSACHGQRGEGGRGAVLATAKLVHASDETSLIAVITRGVPGTEMLPARLESAQIVGVARWILELGKTPVAQVAGDDRRGRGLYEKQQCTTCHAIRGTGGAFGPDLTDIGLRRGPEFLRRSLMEPEAYVPENFMQYRWFRPIPDNFLLVNAVNRAGEQISGARLNEDVFSIVIRDASGQVHSLQKAELRVLNKEWGKSPMPSYKHLSNTELDDLAAYLSSLRGDR